MALKPADDDDDDGERRARAAREKGLGPGLDLRRADTARPLRWQSSFLGRIVLRARARSA
jgi:hypothetical protein